MTPRGKQTVRDLRRSSRSTLLRHLYFHGPLSRQELGTATGLSAGSVSNVTGELLTDGLIEECGSVESDGGRPRILLRVSPGQAHLVGIDIGETQVRVTLFDLALTELASADQPLLAAHDPERVVRMIAGGLDQVLAAAGAPAESVLGIGIGVPGIVEQGTGADPGAGIVVHGQTFGWDAVPFGRMLREHTPLPLYVDNG
ncbi:MAG: ROK family transcriptional regulator, partial [Kitasatospora sp.]|nr:ROK family transcriptional regulator [Kitasatospora sp.]